MSFKTEQEKFWKENFGNEYIERNKSQALLSSNIHFFSNILRKCQINSIIEFGSNVGMNIQAIKNLLPDCCFTGLEINQKSADILKELIGEENVINKSVLDYVPGKKFDMVLSKGFLIHINPDFLDQVYEKIYTSSKKYILICEYYNPSPVSIEYRGSKNVLFKRDFCKEIMTKYKDLRLIDYGFSYRYDPVFSQDDITWFLLEKT
jgi:pseudaminic acid biosynthesis-associated methylase